MLKKEAKSKAEGNLTNEYSIAGYTVNVKYGSGKSFYDCIKLAVNRLNERIEYS